MGDVVPVETRPVLQIGSGTTGPSNIRVLKWRIRKTTPGLKAVIRRTLPNIHRFARTIHCSVGDAERLSC